MRGRHLLCAKRKDTPMRLAVRRSVEFLGKIPPGFYRTFSVAIPVEGLKGLFTDHDIPVDDVIGEYIGVSVSPALAASDDGIDQRYMFQVNDVHGRALYMIDGGDPSRSSFLRYAIASLDESLLNCRFYQYGKRIFMRAERDIPANTELLVSYGADTGDIIAMGPTNR